MNATVELLKPSEAAVVSGVRVRDVNRAIDEHIIPAALISRGDGRLIRPAACTFLAFYFMSAERLTSVERLSTIRALADRLKLAKGKTSDILVHLDWTFRDEYLCIDLKPFAQRSAERLDQLQAARDRVSIDHDILGGTPVFAGTRIPVHDIAAAAKAGISEAEILDDYPSLSSEDIALAMLYADANPSRGRPRPLLASLPKGSAVRSERRVERKAAV